MKQVLEELGVNPGCYRLAAQGRAFPASNCSVEVTKGPRKAPKRGAGCAELLQGSQHSCMPSSSMLQPRLSDHAALIMQIFAREHTARDPLAKSSAEETLLAVVGW